MTDRGPLFWIAVVLVGIVALLGLGAVLSDDDSGDTVSAGEWAENVCGAVGAWRGELEATIEDIRTPNAAAGSEEPQSETPQGRTGFLRVGLQRAVQATETMVEGVDNAGTPDVTDGEQVAELVSDWADSAREELEDAQDSLDEEADSLEEAVEQLSDALAAVGSVLASGRETLADVARTEPALVAVLRDTSTCQELEEETG